MFRTLLVKLFVHIGERKRNQEEESDNAHEDMCLVVHSSLLSCAQVGTSNALEVVRTTKQVR